MASTDDREDHGSAGSVAGPELFSAQFWDERYSSAAALWSGHPNPQLVAEVAGLPVGHALDAGCGEGADAIWLAEQGWRVTAVDVSTVAIGRGAARARQVGTDVDERIAWRQVDLLVWEPEPEAYDLVSAQFMHLPPEERGSFFARLAGGVARGGTLLVVGHSPSDLLTTAHRPPHPDLFFTASEIAAGLDPRQWSVEVCEARRRDARDPDGNDITIHDEVLAARRR